MKQDIRTKIKENKLNPLRLFKKEEERTKQSSSRSLSHNEVIFVATASLLSAFIYTFTKFMIFARWSTFPDNSYFFSWHPVVPLIAIIGAMLYIYCLHVKGVKYWLAYFPAFIAIFYCIIEMSMIHAWLHPDDLARIFSIFGELPDWLTGY